MIACGAMRNEKQAGIKNEIAVAEDSPAGRPNTGNFEAAGKSVYTVAVRNHGGQNGTDSIR